jgi:uncharacterized membrane protein
LQRASARASFWNFLAEGVRDDDPFALLKQRCAIHVERTLGKLSDAKILGGIGSILELIPGVSIVGYILALIAVKYISDELHDRAIFQNMLYAVVTGIVGVAVGAFLLITGGIFSAFTGGMSGLAGGLAFLALIWIVLIISAVFIRRSYSEISRQLNIDAFKTAGTLYFFGAILTIVLVGFIILLIAYIFQIIGFFAIKDMPPSSQFGQPAQPIQSMVFCPSCGAQVESGAKFCKSCGAAL